MLGMPFVQRYYAILEILVNHEVSRFDLKTKRRRNLEEKKFCLGYLLWNPFSENFEKAYNSNVNITIDEQLLS